MIPEAPPGYQHITSVQINELCGLLYGPENPVNQHWRDTFGIEHGTATTGACAAISFYATAGSGGTLLTVVGTACFSAFVGCGINDVVRNVTPCGQQYIDIYVPTRERISSSSEYTPHSPPPLMVFVRCDGGWDVDPAEIAGAARDELEDVADEVTDVGSEVADDIEDAVDDFVDDVLDGPINIIGF